MSLAIYQLRVDHVESTRASRYARLTLREETRARPPMHSFSLFFFLSSHPKILLHSTRIAIISPPNDHDTRGRTEIFQWGKTTARRCRNRTSIRTKPNEIGREKVENKNKGRKKIEGNGKRKHQVQVRSAISSDSDVLFVYV